MITHSVAKKAALVGGLFCCLFAQARAAELLTTHEIRILTAENAHEAIGLYREFLALPNDALYPEQIEALNQWMLQAFNERGFEARLLPTAGSPALYAERLSPGADTTLLVYLQADGQPVEPSAWDQANPYEAVLKSQDSAGDWQIVPWEVIEDVIQPGLRVFARSAADSKGPMTQFLVATDLLRTLRPDLGYNLKVLVDTEEELGSPNLATAIRANRDLLAADMLLIFDGPPHASNQPTVSLGARGIATLTLTTYGPRVAQHSGHYGNFVPNPAFDLARLLASMKDTEGRVTIPGFYDGVTIDAATRAMLEAVPDNEAEILASVGVSRAEQVAPSLQEAIQYPSLNIRGMSAAWTGDQARTVIPPTAVAEIDMRLVAESDPGHLIGSVKRHIVDQGYLVLDRAPTDAERQEHVRIASLTYSVAYGAFRSDPDSRPARMARAGMRHLYGEEPILIRTMGGSIPIAPIIEALGVPAATVPTVNIDNNQHSPNENLRLDNFIEGIAILLAVLQQEP